MWWSKFLLGILTPGKFIHLLYFLVIVLRGFNDKTECTKNVKLNPQK